MEKRQVLFTVWRLKGFPRREKCALASLVCGMNEKGECKDSLEELSKTSGYTFGNTHMGIMTLVNWGLVNQSCAIVGERKIKRVNVDLIVEMSKQSDARVWIENRAAALSGDGVLAASGG